MPSSTFTAPGDADDRIPLERNAGLIMATNISTTAFKASTERLYLAKPHFHKFFARKCKRAPPAIHRSSWVRMRAVKWVIQHFLERPSTRPKVVLNFGCGYDPMPFRLLSQKGRLCNDAKFVDVDYEPLMETKRDIILSRAEMRDLLVTDGEDLAGNDPSILIDSRHYAAIGCDLRNIARLERLLKSVVDLDESSVLCIAEESITFMPVDDADALISWTSRLASDVTFCLLEPCSPDQPDNPYTEKMTEYYAKLGTPLRSIWPYPDDRYQFQRFSNAGFPQVEYQNLWELWADPRFLSPSQRMELDHVEPFDDWEEFALYASHHCLVVAQNGGSGGSHPVLPSRHVESRRNSVSSDDASDISARTSSPNNPDLQHFALRYYRDPGDLCQRHHGSSYPIPDQDAIAIFGGSGPKSCLSTSAVCRPRHLHDETPVVLPPEVGARCCHVITAMNNGDNILVGGRRSPTQPLKDCWLQKGNTWHRIHDLPEGRYRHRIVPVTLPDNVFGAICFGGKVGPTKVAIDVLLWEPSKGWRTLRIFGKDPKPRFGPNFICLGFNHGLLFGGLRQDGVICQGFWRWRLVIRDNVVLALRFRPSHALDTSIGSYLFFARFGASYGFVQDYLLVIGGIARSGCIPKTYEILSLSGTFSTWHDESKEPSFRVNVVDPARTQDCPRAFLVGHSTLRTRTGMHVILGGGANCFNFGDCFNKGIWVLHEREAGLTADWVIVPTKAAKLHVETSTSSHAAERSPEGVLISPTSLKSPQDFAMAVRKSLPLLMRRLNFGPCIDRWSIDYLNDKTCPPFSVLIRKDPSQGQNSHHSAKNVTSMSYARLLEQPKIVSIMSHLCLAPAGGADSIADDFNLPPEFGSIRSLVETVNLHTSTRCGRLHYDVKANLSFQIRGIRKVLLFPPVDLPRLEFSPGSQTSNLDVFCDPVVGQESLFYAPPGTSPHVALLKPGDVLLVPPFWCQVSSILSNTAASAANGDLRRRSSLSEYSYSSDSDLSRITTDETVTGLRSPHPPSHVALQTGGRVCSIVVNVPFHCLDRANFKASEDDHDAAELSAYEQGRQDLEGIIKRFSLSSKHNGSLTAGTNGLPHENVVSGTSSIGILEGIPKDVAKAYLQRLGKELLMKADAL